MFHLESKLFSNKTSFYLEDFSPEVEQVEQSKSLDSKGLVSEADPVPRRAWPRL
jgi:hypothetical protein